MSGTGFSCEVVGSFKPPDVGVLLSWLLEDGPLPPFWADALSCGSANWLEGQRDTFDLTLEWGPGGKARTVLRGLPLVRCEEVCSRVAAVCGLRHA